jgi:hypothetical protein
VAEPRLSNNALRKLTGHAQSRWGDELAAERMKECVWLRPEAVARIEFLEWTAGDRLRHAKWGQQFVWSVSPVLSLAKTSFRCENGAIFSLRTLGTRHRNPTIVLKTSAPTAFRRSV